MTVDGGSRIVIHDANAFGRVAVIFGGTSSERDVSLDTARRTPGIPGIAT